MKSGLKAFVSLEKTHFLRFFYWTCENAVKRKLNIRKRFSKN
jgi:hypothetical protein